MIKRILKISGLTLLVLFLLLAGTVGWIIGTESGLQQTLALAKRFAPGTLQWDEASGKLAGSLRVRNLQYSQTDGIDASVGALDLDWRPGALLGAELSIERFHLNDVQIHLAEAGPQEDTASSTALPDLSLPLSISLADIAINDVAIYPAGQDTPIEIDRIALSGSAEQSAIRQADILVVSPQGRVHLEGDITTRDDYPMDLSLEWQAEIGQSAPLLGEGTLTGSLAQLQIAQQISGFAVASVAVTVTDVTSAPAWDAAIDANLPNATSLSALITGTPQLTLQSSGTPDNYEAQATLQLTTSETGPVTIDTDVSGSTEQLDIHSLSARLDDSDGEIAIAGRVTFASLQSDLQGQWQSLSWPLQGAPQFISNAGSVNFSGSPDNFTMRIGTDVNGDSLPQGQWNAMLEGSTQSLSKLTLLGQTLDGTLVATGTASWESQPQWDLVLVAEGLNPGTQWTDFPGRINLEASSTGSMNDDGLQLNAELKALTGSLREQPLNGTATLRVAGEQLTIDRLNLSHGATRLLADGSISDQLALDFSLDSPMLSTLLPELAGAVSVTGSASGTRNEPVLTARGNASELVLSGNRVNDLSFTLATGLAADFVSKLSVDVSDISAAGQQISEVIVRAQGTQMQHTLALSVDSDEGKLSTQLEGGYRDATWQGFLDSLLLEDTPAGDWHLREPAAITANAQKAELSSPLCLDNTNRLGALCLSGNWLADGESQATATISDLSPALANPYLPPGLILDTTLNGDVQALLDENGNLNADVSLALAPGSLSVEADGSPVTIGLEKTTIEATWQGVNATVALDSGFTELGRVNVQAAIADPAGQGELDGSLSADFPDLTLISAFAPQIQQVSGALSSNLSVAGTLQAPRLEGSLALTDFGAEIPETAMLIKDTQLMVTGNGDGSLVINGESHSGEGQLTIGGNINPTTRAMNFSIDGEEFQVANTAMMQVTISPQLAIAMDDKGMQVNGSVTVPAAYINANGGNEGIRTVSSSSDVVMVSEAGEQTATPASQLNLDVRVILGESVEVEAGDFRGRLEGELRVQQTPGIAPRGTGTIDVVNGDYVIYGQQLNMERGRILFSGGPVDNPALDMEVARTVQEYDVVAGARIQGSAQAPRLELYSDPPMPDASVLSYILLGQPPGTTGGSYTLGKYLTPDLYVSYGIGLFDAINTFNLRYRLTDRLAFEAASGSGSSADLIYTLEK